MTSNRRTPRPEPTGRFTAQLGEHEIEIRSRPGFVDWDIVTPAMQLIAERTGIPAGGRALFWGVGHAALVATLLLDQPDARATVMVTNLAARDVTEATAMRNGVSDRVAVVNYPRDLPEPASFDLAVMLPSLDRDLNRRWLLEMSTALNPGGTVVLAGPNGGGIRTTIGDAAALLGAPREEVSRMKQRLASFPIRETRPDAPIWASAPGVTPGTWADYPVTIGDRDLALVTMPGVFSGDGLDDGTALLLDNLPDLTGKRVLDLGCGSGVIGIAAALAGAASVTMTDIDLLSVATARENIARSGVSDIVAVASDLYGAIHGQRFDVILCNPPFHAGQRIDRDVADAIVRGAPDVLDEGGRVLLVANRFLAYDRALRESFGDFDRIAETERYHVLGATRPAIVTPEEAEAVAARAVKAVDTHPLIDDELRRRFPIIGGGETPPEAKKPRVERRRRTSRSIRRGPNQHR